MSLFSPEHELARSMLRRWCEETLAPRVDALESGEELPYPLVRSFAESFGLIEQADAVGRRLWRSMEQGELPEDDEKRAKRKARERDQQLLSAILSWELCRVCPGFCFALGASLGLAGSAVMSKGTPEQKLQWGLPILRFDKIGAWALTEPDAGSDALGAMRTRAVRDGADFILRGQKRFITNAPYADLFVIYAKFEGQDGVERVGAFIVERGTPGLETSRPLKKMGLHASPTGDIFLDDVRIPAQQLLGGEQAARRGEVVKRLAAERAGMVPMCLGIMERCIEVAVLYTREREQFGQPISNFQLVQATLARMQVAYENGLGLFSRLLDGMASDNIDLKLACAAKLYIAEETTKVALAAVQLLGGNGYMAEYRVEMLARDAKLFEIGGGTNEIQLLTIAREMLKVGS
ncbi:MAG: acyl-CoA dehydrogenase family protein [Myxococcota bacterium]